MTARDRLGRADRSPGLVEGLRRLRRVLPGDPGYGDPLSTAGTDAPGTVARLAEALTGEQPRASRELGLGALQLWQAALERTGRGQGDREVTVVFTDLVGFSTWALTAGDESALELLRAVAGAVELGLAAHGGKVVKRLGDGLMAVFPSPQQALDGVLDARARLEQVQQQGWQPRLRAGLHSGRPRPIGGDYLGVDVNIAARLCERAAGDEVLVSDEASVGLVPERVVLRRKKSFVLKGAKGVPRDMAVYAVTARH